MCNLRGYVLVEGLVSMLILTLGILGLVALQGRMHAENVDAQLRVDASLYAAELMSMAVADSENAGCYTLPIAEQQGCNSNAAQQFTLAWLNEVTGNFPGATNLPPVASLNSDERMTIVIRWQRSQDPLAHSFSLIGQLGI